MFKARWIPACLILITTFVEVNGQCVPCNNDVPSYNIDLTASSNAVDSIISVRNGSCCGASNPDRCIRFFIRVHPNTTEVAFTVVNPAPPGGAGYMVNCGQLTSLATPFCLTNGDTAFCIVFCKSGNDAATYIFTAYDLSYGASEDITLTAGCTGQMDVYNLQEPTVTWNSIYPGVPGAYNSWLSCTIGCDTTLVTPPTGITLPPYVDYVVTGNGLGCFSGLQKDTVRVYTIPQVSVNLTSPTYNMCFDPPQIITANAANGIPPYTFLWSTGETSPSITIDTGGAYTVMVTDSANCSEVSASVTYAGAPVMNMVATANNNLICDGAQLQLNIQTINNAIYYWSGPAGFTSNLQSPVINNFNAQNAGTYSVYASIGNCISDTVYLNIQHQPPGLINVTNQNICIGGSATLTANSTQPGGSFLWLPGNFNTNEIVVTPNATTTYTVTQTINGCTNNPTPVTVNVYNPTLSVNVTAASNSVCAGSTTTVSANISGGIPPFSYMWSNGSTTQNINVPAGNYSVTVYDNNGVGCPPVSDGVTITEIPLPAMPVLSGNNILCEGETLYLNANSTQGATYAWSGPGGFNSNVQNPTIPNINASQAGLYSAYVTVNGCMSPTATINVTTKPVPQISVNNHSICYGDTIGLTINSNLPGGNVYWLPGNVNTDTLIVSPGASSIYSAYQIVNGCTSNIVNSQVTVTQINLNVNDALICYGANAILNVTGASTYQWSNGQAGNSISVSPQDTTVYIVTGFFNGCSSSADAIVSVVPQMILTATSQSSTCYNACNGTATVTVNGDTGPYQYLWNTIPAQNTPAINNLCSGTYTVLVTDNYGCVKSTSATITEPDSIIVQSINNSQVCIGESVTLNPVISGGNGNYIYTWSTGSTTSSITVSPAITTNYTLHVIDEFGCEAAVSTATVTVNDSLNISIDSTIYICAGEVVTMTATGSGGNGNYFFNWSPVGANQNQITVSPSASTNYVVTMTDGCTTPAVTANVMVNVLPLPVADFVASSTVECTPACIDFMDKSISHCPVSSYIWHTSNVNLTSHSSDFSFCYDYPGLYDVKLTVVDSAGCKGSVLKPAFITMNPAPLANFYTNPPGATTNPQIIFINTSEGAILYNWKFGDGYEETNSYMNTYHHYSDTGTYCVELTAINDFGCTDQYSDCLKILAAFQVYIPNAFTPDGYNSIFNFQGMGIDPDNYSLKIYNRWGEMIYQTFDPQRGWNGRQMDGVKSPTGVYVYKFKMKDSSGKLNDFTGFVTLLE